MSENKTIFIIAALLSTALLLWSLERHSYSYYILLRWVVCATAIYGAYLANEDDNQGWTWLLGFIAFLFNPIFKVRLSREIWQPIDIVVAVIFVIAIFKIERGRSYE